MDLKITKLNESLTSLEPLTPKGSLIIRDFKNSILTMERDGWQYDYLVRIGRKSKWLHLWKNEDPLVIPTGLLELPPTVEVLDLPEIPELVVSKEIENLVANIIETSDLPFKPYDYQKDAVCKALTKKKALSIMATGSGKSMTISLCLEYFRRHCLKGALIVPNINLLTQFAADIKSYNLMGVYKGFQKVGGGSRFDGLKDDKFFLITTWQSLVNVDSGFLETLDFVICDEVHRFSSDCSSRIVNDTTRAKYKLGFTGTLPGSKYSKMVIFGLFGAPIKIITSADLISRGLGTPIKVHCYELIHTALNSKEYSKCFEYLDRVKFLNKIPERTSLIANLSKRLADRGQGGTLILYTLIEHGVEIYKEITGLPEIPTLEIQSQLGVFFMEGSVKAHEREAMRLAMDANPQAILIANYSLLSTGVNIKALRYAIFASPMKSFTTIVQSLGRGIRLADGKDCFEVYDIIDHFVGASRVFKNSGASRKKIYAQQKFKYTEHKLNMR